MERRSIFSRVFGSDKNTQEPTTATEVKLLDNTKASFTPYRGDFKNDPDVIKCVDAIARNGAKMHPRHIRNYNGKMENLKDKTYKLLAKQPNELQNAYKFYYQVIYNLEMFNESIIYVKRDSDLKPIGLYPLDFTETKLYEYQGKLFVKFKFGRSKERFVPYDDCIHLTRFTSKDGIFGGQTEPIIKALSMKHILDEGIINAIKITSSIRGVLKTTKSILKPEDIKQMHDQFVNNFIKDRKGKSGIGAVDATTDFKPIELKPTTASDSQVEAIDNKILSYFGISQAIIQSKYSEDEWNAFYESIIEPIGLQMSLEFSNKIFTPTEKNFGNEIIFESNALQYASNKTKIELLRYGNNIMTQNELREVFNLAPREGGDVILIDQNHSVMDENNNDEEGGEENEGN